VLRVGQAYEQATDWSGRQPTGVAVDEQAGEKAARH
jgi:hypothetical protein